MDNAKTAISIVIPVYNEEACVLPLYENIRTACESLSRDYEVVFVDDGSKDRTFDLLERLHGRDNRVRVVRFRKNFGQTAAMAAGFAHACGEIVISMDGDLQNDPADIPRLVARLEEGYDLVCGWRKDRKDKFITRRLPSIIANWLIGIITGVRIHDNGCSLKAYRACLIKNVTLYAEMHRFIPAMSSLLGARIAEMVVNHHPRRFGKSKYGIGRVWRVALDIMTVKMLTGFTNHPICWFGLLSLPFLLFGTFFLFLSLNSYFNVDNMNSFPVIYPSMCVLLYFIFINFIILGLLGEMIVSEGDFKQSDAIMNTSTIIE